MKKSFFLFALFSAVFFSSQALYAATVSSTLQLNVTCIKNCKDDQLELLAYRGVITETLHKTVNLVKNSNVNVTCSGFDVDIDKSVTV